MKVAVIGATGGVGKVVVQKSLGKGYTVVAFSRHPEKLNIDDTKLIKISGDATDFEAVKNAVKDTNIVVCTIGTKANDKNKIRTKATQNIIKAMPENGRFICLSSLGFGKSKVLMPFVMRYFIAPFILKQTLLDHEEQEKLIKNSKLNYTIVKPGNMNEKPETGNYKFGFALDDVNVKINVVSKSDVADFMVKQFFDDRFIKTSVGITM